MSGVLCRVRGTTSPFGTARLSSLTVEEEQGREQQEAARDDREELETVGGGDAWTWESLADIPALAVAFEQYAKRALCLESVLFLWEVRRYVCVCWLGTFSRERIGVHAPRSEAYVRRVSSKRKKVKKKTTAGFVTPPMDGDPHYSAEFTKNHPRYNIFSCYIW